MNKITTWDEFEAQLCALDTDSDQLSALIEFINLMKKREAWNQQLLDEAYRIIGRDVVAEYVQS